MTIYENFLSRGYFPKELPPSFFTAYFASFASTTFGRDAIRSYKPADNFTECFTYNLALPGLHDRQLQVPHPYAFARLANLAAKNLRRLLQKAGRSPFARSRPVYETRQRRAVRTLYKPTNLARERALSRGGSRYVLKVDVSQYYPSLYTHAVGWTIDSKLRQRAHWNNGALLGKKIDQALMDLQGKVSQGIPIGNDISFLLAEAVLSEVDKQLDVAPDRALRWFDDYEFGCDSRDEAEQLLSDLQRELGKFRLRVNPRKTEILELPQLAGDAWHDAIIDASESADASAHAMVRYFDIAFGLSTEYREVPVLLYSIGALFRFATLPPEVLRIAESCIAQAVLSEPGCAQKAFALLKYWTVNGGAISHELWQRSILQLIRRHDHRESSSDIAWALTFCISENMPLPMPAGRVLAGTEDDVICVLALHAASIGLLPGFSADRIEKWLAQVSPDGDHWLCLYEAVRQEFLPNLWPVVASNDFMATMLAAEVTFYRPTLRPYSMILHSGGAPTWIAQKWIRELKENPLALIQAFPGNALFAVLGADLGNLAHEDQNEIETIMQLLGETQVEEFGAPEGYE
jgi:hypothetical protein